MNMMDQILLAAEAAIKNANSVAQLQEIKVEFLGKNSVLNQETKKLGNLSVEEKKETGKVLNELRQAINLGLESKKLELEDIEMQQKLLSEKLDLSLSNASGQKGGIHPITQCMDELLEFFAKNNFTAENGPDIEDDWHNFTALNFGPHHPARQMHDTFFLHKDTDENQKLLRTHTSTIQVRAMSNNKPPFRFVAPGRTYRCDSDMTHTPMFHQIEGVLIDKNITMAHLKHLIIELINYFFQRKDIEIQFRPSYFPFTEPSAEVDIRLSKDQGWLEVLGCGMVHPNVLKNVGINPEEYQGFAFGLGLERFAMLKYGIKDLRQFFEGDIRWLNHYNFSAIDVPNLLRGL